MESSPRPRSGTFSSTLRKEFHVSEIKYHASLTKAIAKEENKAELRKNVKRVMEVIVGLLKDRVDIGNLFRHTYSYFYFGVSVTIIAFLILYKDIR